MSSPRPDFKRIKIVEISPNDYNPQEMPKDKYQGLVGHMRSVGFTDPLKVRPVDKEGGDPQDTPFVMVDGEHRLRAFMEVFPEEMEIDCAVMRGPSGEFLTRSEAIISTIAYNFQHGEENPIKMALALKLAMDSGIMMEDIEDLTGMKRNRIERFLEFDQPPPMNSNLPEFPGACAPELGSPKEPIIMSFAVYPEDRQVIENALANVEQYLPEEVDVDEQRGAELVIMSRMVLGEDVSIQQKHMSPTEEFTTAT
jgi:hypothetical protein